MRAIDPTRFMVCAAAALLPAALAWASDPPKLKEGLWEVHVQRVENPGDKKTDFTYKLCRDHAYDKAANALLKNVKGCTTVLKDLGGDKFESASTCAVSGTTVESKGLAIYANHESAHSETQAKYTPAFNGKTDETMIQDQRYVGSCPSTMKPGDTINPDGFIRHHD